MKRGWGAPAALMFVAALLGYGAALQFTRGDVNGLHDKVNQLERQVTGLGQIPVTRTTIAVTTTTGQRPAAARLTTTTIHAATTTAISAATNPSVITSTSTTRPPNQTSSTSTTSTTGVLPLPIPSIPRPLHPP